MAAIYEIDNNVLGCTSDSLYQTSPCCLLRCRWGLDSGPLGDALQQLSSLWIKVTEVSASKIRVVDRAIRCKRNPPWSGISRGQGVLPNRHCLRVNTAQDPRSSDGEIVCLDKRGESQFYALMFRRGLPISMLSI